MHNYQWSAEAMKVVVYAVGRADETRRVKGSDQWPTTARS